MTLPPRDFKTASLNGTPSSQEPVPVRIRVMSGEDAGREVAAHQGTLVIGTRNDCDLVLTDSAVSRRHLSVELRGARLRIRDLGSKNGTHYQGARVDQVDVPLGATVTLGNTVVAFLPESFNTLKLSERTELHGLLGSSPAMRQLYAQIETVGPTEAAVLIRGETGSGKEGVARALHASSPRRDRPFVVFDCAVVQPELVQSAIFGHVKGAFTGAVQDSEGALRRADGGTLFLDEIAELPLAVQPMLLRALESKRFVPVGDTELRRSDFRVIAASHVDLERAVQQNTFRQDLFYRFALALQVPALRERPEDIPLLARHFAARRGQAEHALDPASMAFLSAWTWPGNVRELQNMVERIVTLGPLTALTERSGAGSEPPNFHEARQLALRAFERSYVENLLERHGGSVGEAAKAAGIARSYLYRLLEETGLKPKK